MGSKEDAGKESGSETELEPTSWSLRSEVSSVEVNGKEEANMERDDKDGKVESEAGLESTSWYLIPEISPAEEDNKETIEVKDTSEKENDKVGKRENGAINENKNDDNDESEAGLESTSGHIMPEISPAEEEDEREKRKAAK